MKNIKKNQKNLIVVVSAFALFVGCAPMNTASLEKTSQGITDSLGCTQMKSNVFDSFYELLDKDQAIPLAGDLKQVLKKKLEAMKANRSYSNADTQKIDRISAKFSEVVDLMLSESAKNPKLTYREQIEKLIEYEMEDQSSEANILTNQKLNLTLKEVSLLSKELDVNCATPDTEAAIPKVSASNGGLKKGLNMVFATAYQSCRVLDLPPMDRSTPDVSGISRVGTHTDGVGGKRLVTDLKAVQGTHYYIRGIASEGTCLPVRNNPLIYDYGGKVAASGNTLSFFKNSGSGTTALGVDCSGYVSAGIAAAGLRYKPGLANKPIFANYGARTFINAKTAGFTCFENITVTPNSSIKVGDILGVKGHVVTVDSMGADPFGIKNFKSASDCSKIDSRNFDIVVSQSSPSKNGIGINKYVARDYLNESGKMKTAFLEIGKQACLSKFQNTTVKPINSEWGFLRHKGTPECFAPRAMLEGESCTKACQ
jgi:hypothetical protein